MIAGLLAQTVAEVAIDEIRRLGERQRREKRMAELFKLATGGDGAAAVLQSNHRADSRS